MSHLEEEKAIEELLSAAKEEVAWLAGSKKLEDAIAHLKAVRARHAERNAICANLESAALEYGTVAMRVDAVANLGAGLDAIGALAPKSVGVIAPNLAVLSEHAIDLARYDGTIHPPKESR